MSERSWIAQRFLAEGAAFSHHKERSMAVVEQAEAFHPKCYGPPMQAVTNKQKILNALSTLADDATFEEAIERLLLLAAMEESQAQLDAGQTVEHDEVMRRIGL